MARQPSGAVTEPTGCGDEAVLSAAQVERWHSEGWLCVAGLMPQELLAEAEEQAKAFYPPPSATGAERERDVQQRFPMDKQKLPALNLTSLEPRLLREPAGTELPLHMLACRVQYTQARMESSRFITM